MKCSQAAQHALLVLLALAASAAASTAEDDAAILRRLRALLAAADPAWSASWPGWQPNDTAHPCTWERVECRQRRVVALRLYADRHVYGATVDAAEEVPSPEAAAASAGPASPPGAPPWGPLLPELAQLERLEELEMQRLAGRQLVGAIPPEWCRAGAFPSLRKLSLEKLRLQGPLPDMQPGALPSLEDLYLRGEGAAVALPPSWGASPLALPALQSLYIHNPLEGPLPAEWAQGFRRLDHMVIAGGPPEGAAVVPAAAPQPTLPHEWARASAFPRLAYLGISYPQLSGSFPSSWEGGGFPSLESLSLSLCNLTGPLPERIFEGHPSLSFVSVEKTQITGTLPAAWAASKVRNVMLTNNPLLSGPAFPPAWSQPGTFPKLETIDLSGCPRLGGTLPAQAPWPLLNFLDLRGTGVEGTIPESWCTQPVARSLTHLSVMDTRVNPALPPCYATAMGGAVFLTNTSSLPIAASVLAQAGQSAGQPAHLPALAALLPLAALLAGAAMACAARRRRQQAAGPEQERQEAECLLVPLQLRGAPGKLSSAGSAASGSPFAAQELPGSGRRARLEALLSAQLQGSDGSGRGGRVQCNAVDLLPLEALPTLLAHQLGSLRRAAAARPGGSRGSGRAAGGQAHAHTFGNSCNSSSVGLDASKAADVDDWAAGALAASPPPSEPGSSPPRSRQWGMDTDSLRLSAGELQLLLGADGRFVELGAGSFAVVYRAKLNGFPVAVKVFELRAGMDSSVVWKEVSLLRGCTHPRIVALLGVAIKGHLVLLAMELMQGGSLRKALQQPEWQHRLRWADRGWRVACDVAEALLFLHSRSVIHSDLKAANVLLSHDCRACVSDLGLAQVLAGPATVVGCSAMYAAPEQLLGQRCTLAADMYSFGILLIELLTQKHWDVRGQWRLPRTPEQCPVVRPGRHAMGVVTLIEDCILSDPSQRPSAAEALARLRAEAPAEAVAGDASPTRLVACDRTPDANQPL